jgi:hypothetical protein
MVLLSAHGLPPVQIAELLDCHPATVRRWITRFNDEGSAGLADRPRCGRPRLGGRQLTSRIAALLDRPGPWTLPRIRRYLGRPQVSPRTLYRRVRLVAIWRRPKLTARGDPDHDLARSPPADPLLLPRPLTGSDAGHRRPLDQPLAAPRLRAELLECRLVREGFRLESVGETDSYNLIAASAAPEKLFQNTRRTHSQDFWAQLSRTPR